MNLGASWTVIERGFVEIDRTLKISLGRFPIGILNELRITGAHQAITASKSVSDKDQQRHGSDRDAIMVRHLTNEQFSELTIHFCGGERRRKYLEKFMACGAEQSHPTAIARGSCDPAIPLLFRAVISLL
jgi:hypothetical protein